MDYQLGWLKKPDIEEALKIEWYTAQNFWNKSDFEKINSLFKEALAAKTEQQENREMMTGLLIHKKGKKTIQQIVLKPKSEYVNKIEVLLKSLL